MSVFCLRLRWLLGFISQHAKLFTVNASPAGGGGGGRGEAHRHTENGMLYSCVNALRNDAAWEFLVTLSRPRVHIHFASIGRGPQIIPFGIWERFKVFLSVVPVNFNQYSSALVCPKVPRCATGVWGTVVENGWKSSCGLSL